VFKYATENWRKKPMKGCLVKQTLQAKYRIRIFLISKSSTHDLSDTVRFSGKGHGTTSLAKACEMEDKRKMEKQNEVCR
jgi:hypothetical protein